MELAERETAALPEIKLGGEEKRTRPLKAPPRTLAYGIGVAMSVFQLYALYFHPIDPWLFRAGHLLFAAVLAFLLFPAYRGSPQGRPSIADLALIALAIAPTLYIAVAYDELIYRAGVSPTPWDVIFGALALGVLLEMTRRITGMVLPLLCLLFLAYAFAGSYLPGPLWHKGYSFRRVLSFIYSLEGIYGIPLGASATYVFLFILFGAILSAARADQFFIRFALALAGPLRGGPAKVSILSSALFGTVSGSSVANVMVDGVINIPLMKAAGFRPAVAGAVEAVTSTGGQIVPPVMGAAAFLMAEILGIPYSQIAIAALIPALLYYVANYWMIDFEAAKTGLRGLSRQELPGLRQALTEGGHLFLPLGVLLFFLMVLESSPVRAVLWGMITALLVSQLRRGSRVSPRGVLGAAYGAARGSIEIAATCGAAGVILGVLSLTGLGVKFASIIAVYSGGQFGVALFLAMIVTLILGMGMPTTAAYAIAASVAAPSLIQLGASPLGAHMFVFYFACLSAITPPVALAAYAAAAIAGSNMWEVGVKATKLGAAGFVVPYMFVYGPPLLFQGSWGEIGLAVVTAVLGVTCLSAGVQGWLLTRANGLERVLLVIAALALIKPGWVTDLVGLAIFFLVLLRQRPAARACAWFPGLKGLPDETGKEPGHEWSNPEKRDNQHPVIDKEKP